MDVACPPSCSNRRRGPPVASGSGQTYATPATPGYVWDGREDLHAHEILYVMNPANPAVQVFEEEGETNADDQARDKGRQRDISSAWAARETRRNRLGYEPNFRRRVGILDVRLLEFLGHDLVGGIRVLHIRIQLFELALDLRQP